VHLVGAGAMGGDIAAWLALHGKTVSIEDQSAEMISPAIRRAHRLYEHKLKDPRDRRDALDRLVPDLAGHGRRRADLVIEAVPEKVDLKREILRSLEADAREDAIIATNTSSILLSDLRDALERPERLAGLHFFNPVAKMPLVEVVGDDEVDENVMAQLTALCSTIDKQPVRVRSRPGFLVNRILTPYLLEALAMLDEGMQAEAIDAAAEAFGMPVGPIELSDQVGLDICLDVADRLTDQVDQPLASIPDWLRRKVDDGHLGVKSGRGLYEYDENGKAKKQEVEDAPGEQEIDRLILPMINTAAWCLAEGICEGPDVLDGAVIFGTGFAPFRGGPVHYARSCGISDIQSRLESLADKHGERFRPAPDFSSLLE
jgi:3-hydroxyacyl-CoA dehydrogenase/enoyl-CoA hydratase/3-hydroxybutyryl-CoA epimerase